MKTGKWVSRIWGAVGVLLTLVVLFVAYVHFAPVTPITIESVHVESPQIAGQTLTYTIHACKHVDKPSTVIKQMIGVGKTAHNAVTFEPTHGLAPVGCHVTTITVPLPSTVTPGTYYLRDVAEYSYFLKGTVNVFSQSNVFTVKGAG